MLKNLVPEFLSLLQTPDPMGAYHEYLQNHDPVLRAYWRNYVLDLESPHVDEVIQRALNAGRQDLKKMLEQHDVEAIAAETIDRCADLFEIDAPLDVYLMVGVGGANAGELVVDGRGVAFICLEHFTGRANPETYGLGLAPELIPMWIAHEVAHTVRYTSPLSRSEMVPTIKEAGGNYDYWETGSRTRLLELFVNEGLAVTASRHVAPGRDRCEYLGYGRRQYRRLRELEAFLRSAISGELEKKGLGYRLRYLSGGMSPAARLVSGKVIPERAGYYLGERMVEAAVSEMGLAGALRASADECIDADREVADIQTA
jgi:hypothetical protein